MGVSLWSTTAGDNDDADVADGVNWGENQFPSTVNNSARAMMKGVAELLLDMGGAIVSTGTSNNYIIATNVGYAALAEKMVIVFEADKTSSGAATATVDGLTTKSIYQHDGTATESGDIVDGGVYFLVYNGALDGFVGLNIIAVGQPLDSDLTAIAALTTTTFGRALLELANAAALRTAGGLVIGTDVQAYDADTLKADVADVLTAGFATTPYDFGTKSTGTFTPDEANGNFQYGVNGGAHTLAPPTNNCALILQYTNNGSAGAITTSGFTKVSGAFTTANGDDFFAYITKANGFSHLNIVALQ